MATMSPGNKSARVAAWLVGGIVSLVVLAGFLFWLGTRLGYIEVIEKVSSGSGEDSSTTVR